MKTFKKFATIFCCALLVALSAMTLTSCKDDDKESTLQEIVSSRQWIGQSGPNKITFDIAYSDPNIFQYTGPIRDGVPTKFKFTLANIEEGDFGNGFQIKLTFTDFDAVFLIKVVDNDTIVITPAEDPDILTLSPCQNPVDFSLLQEMSRLD
ncbi:MAG: hypothetical protein IKM58_05890 [Tidjanibacter sp.]|nr:hypothetical protein [Tidjanibacter sp.]